MDEASKRLSAVQAMAILPLSFLALIAIGIVAVIGLVEPQGSPGILESIFAALVVVNLFYYLQKNNLILSVQALVGIIGGFLAVSLYTESISRIGVFWLVLFPVLAMLLLGRYVAFVFTGIFMAVAVPALLLSGDWQVSFTQAELAGALLGVLVVTGLLAFYDKALRDTAEKVVEAELDAAETTNLKSEIAQRQNAEAQMSAALEKLEENNQQLERVTAIDEATISSIGEAVLIVDQDGIIVRANPSAGRVLGINQEDIIGKEITDNLSFAKQSDEKIALTREQVVIYQSIAHRSINDETYKITQPDGTTVYAQMTASPLVVSGEVYGAVVVVRDVTEEVGVDRAKTEFVSIASHQLRTPLSTINWYLEMVLAGDFGEVNAEQKEFIEEAYGASKRMGDLINALLNASRLDVGVVAIEPTENVDVREVLHGVLTDLEAKIAAKSVTIQQSIDETVKPMLLDVRIMDIIFLNLLTNAIKYSPKSSIIEVRGTTDEEFLVLEVADHGYGIPKSAQGKIFTKMFRAENAVEQEPDGNGLGLYIIKSILETIGGSITFDSEENKGTTFTVKIPLSGMEAREGAKQLSLDPNLN
jgi:PAS domain S-box-containing protein